jgi:hypothetical protein
MRRWWTLVLYLTMMLVGLYLDLWVYHAGSRYLVLMLGSFLLLLGAYLLWMDFLSSNREKL